MNGARLCPSLLFCVGVVCTTATAADSDLPEKALRGGPYVLRAHAYAAGGGSSQAQGYRLHTAIGQADAGILSGGPYALHGGLLTDSRQQAFELFGNGFE